MDKILGQRDGFRPDAIYYGDCAEIMKRFPADCVDLIYADPPFFSNQYYETSSAGNGEPQAFDDRWRGGIKDYIAWMEPRLSQCHRVLKDDGSMYLHCDWHAVHYLKVLMDKIFGYDNFQREIVWRVGWVSGFKSRAKNYIRNHETILFYTKSPDFTFNKMYTPHRDGYKRRGGGENPRGIPLDDVWLGISSIQHLSFSKEKLGYPTQKPEALMNRIIEVSSNKGDKVLDPFCGCGTTIATAKRLGRSWIGIDASRSACRLAAKRLGTIEMG